MFDFRAVGALSFGGKDYLFELLTVFSFFADQQFFELLDIQKIAFIICQRLLRIFIIGNQQLNMVDRIRQVFKNRRED